MLRAWLRFRLLTVAGLVMLLPRMVALAQSPSPPFLIQSFPAGQRPLGVDAAATLVNTSIIYAAVANSGEDSVSVFTIRLSSSATALVSSSSLIPGIPSPFGVNNCGFPTFVITSPTDNSITIIDAAAARIRATVKVGALPFSAACFVPNIFVSNYGDSSVSVVDMVSFKVVATIPNVPGNRALHGVRAPGSGSQRVWVAGTDANVITILDPTRLTVVTSIPLRGPTFLGFDFDPLLREELVAVGTPLDNSIVRLSVPRLTLNLVISGIPTPQDFRSPFATTGAANSVARIAGTIVDFITGIPGAAGIAGGGFVSDPTKPALGVFVLVASPDLNRVFMIQAQPALPSQFRITDGASFSDRDAPGMLASLFATTGVAQNFTASTLPLPERLGGVALSIGGRLNFDANSGQWNYSPTGSLTAGLLFVGPDQINFQFPLGITPESAVPAQLIKPDGSTLLTTLNITASAPGIFTVLQNGQGQGAVLNQDNSQNFGTNPAKIGSVIQIFATGAGETTPPLLSGEAAPASGNPLVLTNVQPTVTIGGQNARVLFSGMAPGFVGLWQINVEVPQTATPGPAVALVISGGAVSSNTVTIAVE